MTEARVSAEDVSALVHGSAAAQVSAELISLLGHGTLPQAQISSAFVALLCDPALSTSAPFVGTATFVAATAWSDSVVLSDAASVSDTTGAEFDGHRQAADAPSLLDSVDAALLSNDAPYISSPSPIDLCVMRETFVEFDVWDDYGLFSVLTVVAVYPSGVQQVAYTLAGGFDPAFLGSTAKPIAAGIPPNDVSGYHFAVRPKSGWPESRVRLRIQVVDHLGEPDGGAVV